MWAPALIRRVLRQGLASRLDVSSHEATALVKAVSRLDVEALCRRGSGVCFLPSSLLSWNHPARLYCHPLSPCSVRGSAVHGLVAS